MGRGSDSQDRMDQSVIIGDNREGKVNLDATRWVEPDPTLLSGRERRSFDHQTKLRNLDTGGTAASFDSCGAWQLVLTSKRDALRRVHLPHR